MAVAIPLIVAVTGHRDIAPGEGATLRERFGELLGRLQRQYPSTPLALLCSLAPGAEILAAEEALTRHIPVFAALPMARERWEAGFTPEQVARFRAVLAQCERVEVVGGELPVHVAYYGDIVVAFWDGVSGSDEEIGEILTMRQSGIPSRHAVLGTYVPDVGPVYQIVTPREGKPSPANAFAINVICPTRFPGDTTCERDFLTALDRYNAFDRDLSATRADGQEPSLADLMKRIDGIANRLQTWHLRIVRGLYVLAFAAGAAQLLNEGPSGLEIKLGLLALAFAGFIVARRFDFENRYQDYRALAEALRVQQAWRAAGLHLRVESEYLRMQQDELSWIRMALRTIYLLYVRNSHRDGATDRTVVSEWISDQRTYYDKATIRQQQLAHRYIVLGRMLTFLALALSIPAAIALLMKHAVPWTPALTSVPPAVAALAALLLRFYVQQRGFQENARRYHHMLLVFDYAQRRIAGMDASSTEDGYDKTVSDLGKEALAEHASWLALHRERPLNFVAT